MKTKNLAFAAPLAALAALACTAAPAAAQSLGPVSGYGALGLAHADSGDINYFALGARVGARFGSYLGAEGEGAIGLNSSKDLMGGATFATSLNLSYAGYAVGYIPLSPKFDLFGRVGYGASKVEVKGPGGFNLKDTAESWNYGGGVQYFLTAKDGVKADYTRESFTDGPGHANVWALSYVRKF